MEIKARPQRNTEAHFGPTSAMALRSIVVILESLLTRGFAQIGFGECQAIQAWLQLHKLSVKSISVGYVCLLQPGFIARCGRSLQGTKAPFRSRPRTSGISPKPTSAMARTLGKMCLEKVAFGQVI